MKIAVIGASGSVGSRIVKEALLRKHEVTGIARKPDAIQPGTRLHVVTGDIGQPAALAKVLAGHEVVVSAVRFVGFELDQLLGALEVAGKPRLVMVGGAGSLLTENGSVLAESPNFPAAAKAEAQAGAEKLRQLRAQSNVTWTFLSPSALFAPGERTGKFRLGQDDLLIDTTARKSWISQEDFAIAMLDEIEVPRHLNQRFTAGY